MMCNRKQCSGGYPLRICPKEKGDVGMKDSLDESSPEPEEPQERPAFKVEESEFNPDFIRHMLDKLEWDALVATLPQCEGLTQSLPPSYTDSDKEDENFLKAVHDVIIDYHILEADLKCPKCDRVYPITKGIPNMLLQDDEV
ncbi:Protein trm112, putative [Perkinsus marinus ATCC 50983]|uniref:Protein trm112, putative n=1 Tax=Perkinsus marinus (strain ATCC 50983 / TXsc) TaxID=423536 RepID=C5KHT1_PERM5|nr:Protein trm112, putative [Perkinsus marinus ATCC 50983]EER16143.1 Protein trm112, putative [Perkinsus marinus ATCC 50983]|eukprot:XP_002784347.1 Protein trm112, putative [Perkinsus marinus ATCC 50983]